MGLLERVLLGLYPRALRDERGDELVAFWASQRQEPRYRGALGRARYMLQLLRDVLAVRLRRGRRSSLHSDSRAAGRLRARSGRGGGSGFNGTELKAIVRSHLRHPTVGIASTLSMGVGVGVATLMFSLVHTLLSAPLDVPDPEHVFRLSRDASGEAIFSYPEVEALRGAASGIARVVAHQVNEVVVRWSDEPPSTAWFELVERGYFETFRVPLGLGAGFSGAVGAREVVLSHAMWDRLGSERAIVGRTLRVNGVPFEVVGVGAEGFGGTLAGVPVELWVSIGAQEVVLPNSGSVENVADRFLVVSGRMLSGATLADVQAAARRADVDGADPEWARQIVVEQATGLLPLLQNGLRPIFGFLSIMFGIVVVIACVNVTGVMSARGTERIPEYSMRLALGASSRHLVQMATLEALVLTVPGVLAAVGVAWVGTRLVTSIPLPAGVPIVLEPSIDPTVFGFALFVTLTSSLIAVVVPIWIAVRRAAHGRRRLTRGVRRARSMRRFFVGAQVTLATMLLAISSLMARGIGRVGDIDPGFRVDGIVVVEASADLLGYDPDALDTTWREAIDAARSVPGVQGAGALLFVPMGSRADRVTLDVRTPGWTPRPVLYNVVTGGALAALDIDMVRGRTLTDTDGRSTGPVPLLINETLAREAFPEGDPLGRAVGLGGSFGSDDGQIVGVTRDATYRRLGEGPTPHVYVPFGRSPRGDMVLVVRTDRDTDQVIGEVASQVRALDPELVVTGGTMASFVDESTFWSRIAGAGTVTAGLGGLLLALVGLFGSVSYEAQRRLREVAVRRALGASERRARMLLLGGSLRVTTVAIVLGLFGAVGLGGVVRALLHGVPPTDPVAMLGVAGALLVTVVVATALPAGRAVRAQPADLLREE